MITTADTIARHAEALALAAPRVAASDAMTADRSPETYAAWHAAIEAERAAYAALPDLRRVQYVGTALVGRSGTERHRFTYTLDWSHRPGSEPGSVSVLTGQVYCGSQRSGSYVHSVDLDPARVSCERCIARTPAENVPASDVLTTDNRGRIVVRDDFSAAL